MFTLQGRAISGGMPMASLGEDVDNERSEFLRRESRQFLTSLIARRGKLRMNRQKWYYAPFGESR